VKRNAESDANIHWHEYPNTVGRREMFLNPFVFSHRAIKYYLDLLPISG